MPRVSEKQAIELLRQGDLVALPTETVYGLAARIDRPESIAKIFAAKGRPHFNPLIVHTATIAEELALAAEVSPLARTLAEHFWPGPLTLVLPRTKSVPSIVTAGHDTVALRVPRAPRGTFSASSAVDSARGAQCEPIDHFVANDRRARACLTRRRHPGS